MWWCRCVIWAIRVDYRDVDRMIVGKTTKPSCIHQLVFLGLLGQANKFTESYASAYQVQMFGHSKTSSNPNSARVSSRFSS